MDPDKIKLAKALIFKNSLAYSYEDNCKYCNAKFKNNIPIKHHKSCVIKLAWDILKNCSDQEYKNN